MSNSLYSIFAHFLFFGERCEWSAYFAQIKWVIRSSRSEEMSDVSESLITLTKNEQMSESLIFLSDSLIRSVLDKKKSDSLRNQMSEFPALKNCNIIVDSPLRIINRKC